VEFFGCIHNGRTQTDCQNSERRPEWSESYRPSTDKDQRCRICRILTIPKEKKSGELSDEEIKRIESVIAKPLEYGAPVWMINRRNDPESGTDLHLVMSDLRFWTENDIKLMKKIKSWKGVRHMLGQPVRGQRTKSNFRRNKGKVVAVVKKKMEPSAKEA